VNQLIVLFCLFLWGAVTLEEMTDLIDTWSMMWGACQRGSTYKGPTNVELVNGRQQGVPVGWKPAGGVSRTLGPGQDKTNQPTLHVAS
jgi:hypothetical protein